MVWAITGDEFSHPSTVSDPLKLGRAAMPTALSGLLLTYLRLPSKFDSTSP
jgi:hypothetical protein